MTPLSQSKGGTLNRPPNRPSGLRDDQAADGKILPLVERRFHLDKTASHDTRESKPTANHPFSVWIDATCIGKLSKKKQFWDTATSQGSCLGLNFIYSWKVLENSLSESNLWNHAKFCLVSILYLDQMSQMSLCLRINLFGTLCSQLKDSVWLFCSKHYGLQQVVYFVSTKWVLQAGSIRGRIAGRVTYLSRELRPPTIATRATPCKWRPLNC